MKPIETNQRAPAREVFEAKQVVDEEPWYGIEQEYTLLTADARSPLGWPSNGFPAPQVMHASFYKYYIYILCIILWQTSL